MMAVIQVKARRTWVDTHVSFNIRSTVKVGGQDRGEFN